MSAGERGNDVVVVGAGFAGLSAAHALARAGHKVVVLEADVEPGGLAGTFAFADGVRLEKFYHHWFNNDTYIPALVEELGMDGDVVTYPSRTGMYFNGRVWKLSTPLDLLRFKPLSLVDRLRLGLLVFQVRRVRDWRSIEHLSIREWLEPICGREVYRVVWEPLIQSKFSVHAERIGAVWMWKKLVLRGGTRNSKGGEELAYFKGGFGRLAAAMVKAIEGLGGRVEFAARVTGANVEGNRVASLETTKGTFAGDEFLFTTALPITADILADVADRSWIERLRRVRYLGNVCLVLRLDRSLSDTYWLNVNDPGFPFVGVIEHTNFDLPEHYNGSHIVFLSRYVAKEDPVWAYSDEAYADYALEHLFRMFPAMDRSSVIEYAVWRAEFAQPVTERNYSEYVPGRETPFPNVSIASMAQVYPEDRGTNYAIRDGKAVAELIASRLRRP